MISVTCEMFTAQEFMDFYQISCGRGLILDDLFKLVIYEKSKTGRVADFTNLLENKPTTDFSSSPSLAIPREPSTKRTYRHAATHRIRTMAENVPIYLKEIHLP